MRRLCPLTRSAVSAKSSGVESGICTLSICLQMSTAMMSAPSAASLTACARPWPRAAPVMKAVFPVRVPVVVAISVDELTLGGITGRHGGQHLDVGCAVEQAADLAEHPGDRRSGAVRLQRVGVGPLFDEDEGAVGLVQGVQLAARFVVDGVDGPLTRVAHSVHRLRLGLHGGDDDYGHRKGSSV